jgi:predicted peptidase
MIAIEWGFIRNSGPISKFDFKHFKDLPVWVFHNRDDDVVPFDKGKEPVDAAKAVGGSPRFTVHESGKHKMQLHKNLNPEVIDWMFSHSR